MSKHEKTEKNIALYRKYRPETFEDVIGQDHIVKAIQGALEAGKVAHAYLLSGPRGTGKTTIARIIARALGSSAHDIYEMDAASNRKIEDARDIRENVRTLPFDSKYKVYILDEVHMLTKEAWNALLKTIEEPPEYVIFILATTELEKVPETIVSRCQTFVFKKPTDSVLAEVITRVSKKEGYTLEEGGAELIALIASGAFRDALGTLQKVISFSKDKKISLKEIETVTGAPEGTLIHEFLNALAENNIEKGYAVIGKALEQNIDTLLFIKMILSKLRYALLLRYAPETKKYIAEKIPEEELKYLTELIAQKPLNISSGTLSILLDTYQSSRTAVIDSLPLELALIKIMGGEK